MTCDFAALVRTQVARIPRGRVASYGQIARLIGCPRAARRVGRVMGGRHPLPLPCHRVIRRDGALCQADVFGGPGVQQAMLEAEGVVFLPDGRVDMARCQWDPREGECV